MRVKYPLGIQTFSEIREEGYVYLDKTGLIHTLLSSGKAYFLARPRRFGKSLLISTFEALFSGQKRLFDGLAIASTDYDFAVYPVVTLEFSRVDVKQAQSLENYIINATNHHAKIYGITLEIETYEQRFEELLFSLYEKTGQKVVLLVDEYDKPILDNLFNEHLDAIKKVMSRFYAVVKSLDKYLRFVFITGVSKFAKVSVFSGMNHLSDISMNRRYATVCGITQQELVSRFDLAINELANLEQLNKAQTLAKIKHWYNGYQFHHLAVGVYNPYSLLSLFENQEFKNYWFTTATPTFLLDLLQNKEYDLKELTQRKVGAAAFDASDPQDMEIQSLFVQTGYLTIKAYHDPLYQLDFPNLEVKKSFYDSVAARYSHIGTSVGQSYMVELTQAIQAGNIDHFFTTLKVFFANIPYDITIKQEKYYQSLFYAIFTLIGLTIDAEVHTNIGRIDCVLQTQNVIYIIEFHMVNCSQQTSIRPSMVKKLNDTCKAALQQIHDNKYAQKYQRSGKEIVLIGVAFDQDSRNIGEFRYQKGSMVRS